MRYVVLCSLCILVACGSEAPDAPAPPSQAPVDAAETTPEVEAEAEPEPASLDTPAAQRTALQNARIASRDERYDDSLELFSQLLRVAPRARRIWCEAGYVLHKSGDNSRAARFLDHGLGLYPSGSAAEDVRVPLAMCLYNRGLVHEASEEFGLARNKYEQSLELRANATVQRRLDALHDGDIVTSRFFAATDEAAFRTALGDYYRGFNDFESEPGDRPADIHELGKVALENGEASILSVWSSSYPLSEEFLVVAFPVEGGFRITTFEVGMRDETDHGHEGESAISTTASALLDHGLLRAELSVVSSESYMDELMEGDDFCYLVLSEPTTRDRYTLLCDPGTFECSLLHRAVEVVSPGSVGTDECEGFADLASHQPQAAPTPWALSMRVENENEVRFGLLTGSGQRTPVSGPVAWREWSHLLPLGF